MLVYLSYAFGGPILQLEAEGVGHHEAILAGSFFTLAGLYWWVRALVGGHGAAWQLALAGFLFGCAMGSRMTTFGFALGAGLVLAWHWLQAPRRWPATGRLLAFGLPPATIVALLLVYNFARFDSFTEFGLKYQFTGIKGFGQAFDLSVVGYNLVAYLSFLPKLLPYFPYVVSDGSGGEGWFLTGPFACVPLLAPLIVLAPLAMLRLPAGELLADGLPSEESPAGWRRPISAVRSFVIATTIGFVTIFGTLMTWPWASTRFIQDFLPPMILLGGLGFWTLYPGSGAPRHRHLAYGALGTILGLIALVVGLGLGFNQLSLGHSDGYAQLAYRLDSMTAGVLQRVAPGTWPASYLADEVQRRPWGVFYLERRQLTLRAPPDGWIRSLEIDSLFPASTRLQPEIDGMMVASQRIRPGEARIPLERPLQVTPSAPVMVRLSFPNQPARSADSLWPVRVRGLSNKVEVNRSDRTTAAGRPLVARFGRLQSAAPRP